MRFPKRGNWSYYVKPRRSKVGSKCQDPQKQKLRTDFSGALGVRLRNARINAGISLRQFASLMTCGESAVARIEKGLSAPTTLTLVMWCLACDVSIDEVVPVLPDMEPGKLKRQQM